MSDEAIKQRILDAAEACLLAAGTSARLHGLIAERAGVSRPTVYKYVGDQHAIVGALLRREEERYLDAVEPVIRRRGSLRKQFLDVVVFTVTYVREHVLFQALLREQPHAVLAWLTIHAEPGIRRALTSMKEHVTPGERGLPRIEAVVVVEWAIRLAISLITTPSVTGPLDTREDLRRYVASLLDIGAIAGTARS